MSTVEIPLTRGYVAIVDAADADLVLAFKWSASVIGRNVYAVRSVRRPDGSRTPLLMHKFLTGYAVTDHVNGNGLDNRRANLREATITENNRNARLRSSNTSGFKGVHWNNHSRQWQAQIRTDGGNLYLGLHPTAEEAALAYDTAAREQHGEYASVNFPAPGERAA